MELWSNDSFTEREIDVEFGLNRVLDGIEHYITDKRPGRQEEPP